VDVHPAPAANTGYVFVNKRNVDLGLINNDWMGKAYESFSEPALSFEQSREVDQLRGPVWRPGNRKLRSVDVVDDGSDGCRGGVYSIPPVISESLAAMQPLWIDETPAPTSPEVAVSSEVKSSTVSVGAPGPGWRISGNLFADGHCSRTGIKGLDRASWSIVEVSDEGAPVAWVFGAVPADFPKRRKPPSTLQLSTRRTSLLSPPRCMMIVPT